MKLHDKLLDFGRLILKISISISVERYLVFQPIIL